MVLDVLLEQHCAELAQTCINGRLRTRLVIVVEVSPKSEQRLAALGTSAERVRDAGRA